MTIKHLGRLKKIHELIKNEKTGTPEELAEELKISKRTLFLLLNDMKILKAPISYSRINHTYYYTKNFDFKINISIEVLDEKEIREIAAGTFFKVFSSVQGCCTEQPYLCTVK